MEQERAVKCVPAEMIERLKAFAERLWGENNPSAVHLNAILEEFEPDIKVLGQIVREYETEYAARIAAKEKEFARRSAALKSEAEAASGRLEALEKERAALARSEEAMRRELTQKEETLGAEQARRDSAARKELAVKEENFRRELAARDARIAELQSAAMEDERDLNLKYVAKMQELYDRTNAKEMEMLAKWEEKNRSLDARLQALEHDYADKAAHLDLREKALEEDAKARKVELVRTFDRIKAGLDARENALIARERALSYWEKSGAGAEGGENERN